MLMLFLLAAAIVPADAVVSEEVSDIVVVARRFDDAVCNIAVTCVGQHKKRPAFLQCVAAGRQTFLDNYRHAERNDDAQH